MVSSHTSRDGGLLLGGLSGGSLDSGGSSFGGGHGSLLLGDLDRLGFVGHCENIVW